MKSYNNVKKVCHIKIHIQIQRDVYFWTSVRIGGIICSKQHMSKPRKHATGNLPPQQMTLFECMVPGVMCALMYGIRGNLRTCFECFHPHIVHKIRTSSFIPKITASYEKKSVSCLCSWIIRPHCTS